MVPLLGSRWGVPTSGSVPCRSSPAGTADLPFSGQKWAALCICLVLSFPLCLLGPLFALQLWRPKPSPAVGGPNERLPFWVWRISPSRRMICATTQPSETSGLSRLSDVSPSVHDVEKAERVGVDRLLTWRCPDGGRCCPAMSSRLHSLDPQCLQCSTRTGQMIGSYSFFWFQLAQCSAQRGPFPTVHRHRYMLTRDEGPQVVEQKRCRSTAGTERKVPGVIPDAANRMVSRRCTKYFVLCVRDVVARSYGTSLLQCRLVI